MTKLALVFIAALFASAAHADERERLFEGMGIKLDKITDSMTDKTECVMFVDHGPIYLGITPSRVNIFSNSDELLFAFDSKHLLRVGDGKPVTLTYLTKQNGLQVSDAPTVANVQKALAARTPVKVRFFDWPSHDQHDRDIVSPAFAYAWGKAEKGCGWKSLGVPAELPKAELRVYTPAGEENAGYAKLSVEGHDALGLQKNWDRYGGGCHLTVGLRETIGMMGGRWTNATVDLGGSKRIVIRDADGKVLFDEKVPNTYDPEMTKRGNPWEPAKRAASVMWEAAPHGSVSIESGYVEKSAMLYGFRELWTWGVEKCGFPAVRE